MAVVLPIPVGIPQQGGETLSTETPVTLTLQNGFTNLSGYTAQAIKYGNVVEVRATVQNGTANSAVFTLPDGMRPSADFRCPVYYNGGAHRVNVLTTGEVIKMGNAGSELIIHFSFIVP